MPGQPQRGIGQGARSWIDESAIAAVFGSFLHGAAFIVVLSAMGGLLVAYSLLWGPWTWVAAGTTVIAVATGIILFPFLKQEDYAIGAAIVVTGTIVAIVWIIVGPDVIQDVWPLRTNPKWHAFWKIVAIIPVAALEFIGYPIAKRQYWETVDPAFSSTWTQV